MKLSTSLLVVCAVVLLSFSISFGQEAASERSNRMIRPLPANARPLRPGAPNDLVAGNLHPGGPLPRASEIRREIKEKLKITDEDKISYRKSVNDSKANIVRLLSALSCNTSLLVDVSDERCADSPDFSPGAYYSLRYKDYGESPWTDLSLVEGELTAGNRWHTLGILVDLGETDLSKIDDESEQVKALWGMPSAETADDANEMKKKLQEGFLYGDLFVVGKVKLRANHTYLLRTLTYRFENDRATIVNGFSWFNTDSCFVFKVADFDGERLTTLAWKKLMQRVAPILKERDIEKKVKASER